MVFDWDPELLKLLPDFTRARGPYLYTRQGRRYIDLWLMGGFALMGHRAFKITQTVKNRISTGLLFDLPSIHAKRLVTAMKKEFPQYPHFKIYHSWEQAKEDISRRFKTSDISPQDPLFTEKGGLIGLWRPFVPFFTPLPQIMLPVIPFQMGGGPIILGFQHQENSIQDNYFLSPVLAEGLLRSYYDLKKFNPPVFLPPGIEMKNWKYLDHYFVPAYTEKEYSETFKQFLSHNIIISPHYKCPSFLASELSKGDVDKLIKLMDS